MIILFNYYNEYLQRLHTLSPDLILEPRWKETFVASLPNWVSTAVTAKLQNVANHKFGVIQQAVKAVILELCTQMKVARAANNPNKPSGYQQLCKQYHLQQYHPNLGGRKKHRKFSKAKAASYLQDSIIFQAEKARRR